VHRVRPSYAASPDLLDELGSDSALRAVQPIRMDDVEDEATRSPRQSYVALSRLRSFDEPTRIGPPRPSYVAPVELDRSGEREAHAEWFPPPAPRRSHVAAKELRNDDRRDLETVTTYFVRPSYVDSSEVERVDAYADTDRLHPFTGSEQALSSGDVEVMDRFAQTDEDAAAELERVDPEAFGRYLFDDCPLPPQPEPLDESDAFAPPFGGEHATPSQPVPPQSSLLPRIAEIQRMMEERQRRRSLLPENEVRSSAFRHASVPPAPASTSKSPWVVSAQSRIPTLEPPVMFGLPTPRPSKSRSVRSVLVSVASAGLGIFIAAVIAVVVVLARSDDPPARASSAKSLEPASIDTPSLVPAKVSESLESATASTDFLVIGDPLDEPAAAPAAKAPAPATPVAPAAVEASAPRAPAALVVAGSPAPVQRTTAAPAAPAAQKPVAPAAPKMESAPAAPSRAKAKSGEKSVEEILAELGEEQLRR